MVLPACEKERQWVGKKEKVNITPIGIISSGITYFGVLGSEIQSPDHPPLYGSWWACWQGVTICSLIIEVKELWAQ